MSTSAVESGRVAAFFDLDGTLLALPSLERRFFRTLRYRRAISAKNYLLWLREAVRLASRGTKAMLLVNKMYLGGVAADQSEVCGPRLALTFYQEGIERAAWHAKQGHRIVLLSGTLEPLAQGAAQAMGAELAACGVVGKIRVCATRLEEANGRWTGRILGEAMIGEAKARAVKRLAEEMQLELGRCYAYGDSVSDRWLLAAVGKPATVNPSKELARLAGGRGWPVLRWEAKGIESRRQRGETDVRRQRAEATGAEEPQGLEMPRVSSENLR